MPSLQGSLQAINDGGFIENFASHELDRIRRQINHDESRVRQVLQDILKKQADHLTETLIASRNGRAVLPVKNSYRNRISGVVHDISASGSTVYIEPRAVVQLNEEITQLRADERHEMALILRELSNMLRPHTNIIRNNAWVLGHLDFVHAKFLFMQENKAVVPQLSTDKTVQLLQARHPLLTNPVANDLHFLDELTVIVITGPNTGGKTVMLKTLGLAQLMAQSGLPILADKGSKVAVFNEIFADIGDEQSIEQSLSTFSSHMTNIVDILAAADKDSLVLVDELGAGTDPQEGASLAISILEHLRLMQVKTMATTHYPELKAYGIETEFVENASMEFDTETLSPTYHFMQGVPGRSNAFEIARRLGLAEVIVNEAERLMDSDTDVNRIIERLKPHEVIEAKSQLKKLAPEVDLSKNKVLKKAKKLRAPRVGDDIIVTAYGQRGTLINQTKNGKWEVQVGLIKMMLKEDEFSLVKVQEEAQKPKKKQVHVVKKSKKSAGPRARLDLRGKRYEEAMQELDEFIDQALLNNIAQVDIIHGIGTGVIREGVTKYLSRNKHVKSFGYAPQNAGGSGCTIANLG